MGELLVVLILAVLVIALAIAIAPFILPIIWALLGIALTIAVFALLIRIFGELARATIAATHEVRMSVRRFTEWMDAPPRSKATRVPPVAASRSDAPRASNRLSTPLGPRRAQKH